jgi:hypothetical protein
MDLKNLSFRIDAGEAVSTTMSLFFEGLPAELDTYHKGRAKKFADESQILVRNMILRMFSKVVYHNPGVDISKVFKKLSESPELEAARQVVTPIADTAAEKCGRIEGALHN